MQFGRLTHVCPRNHLLDGDQDPLEEGAILGGYVAPLKSIGGRLLHCMQQKG